MAGGKGRHGVIRAFLNTCFCTPFRSLQPWCKPRAGSKKELCKYQFQYASMAQCEGVDVPRQVVKPACDAELP